MPSIPREQIARAARIYASNQDAGAALGIASGSFGRLCRHYEVETPQKRKRRANKENLRRQRVLEGARRR